MRWLRIYAAFIIAWAIYSCIALDKPDEQTCSTNIHTGVRKCWNPEDLICKNQQPEKLQIQYPRDLAVTRDGSSVYVMNGNCLNFNHYHYLISSGIKISCNESLVEELISKSIYQVMSHQKLSLLNISDTVFSPCEMGFDIEIDSQDNLYVSRGIRRVTYQDFSETKTPKQIYKFSPQTRVLTLIGTNLEDFAPTGSIAFPRPSNTSSLGGPHDIYITNNQIYYGMSGAENEPKRINRLEPDGTFTNIHEDTQNINFAIYKNTLYRNKFGSSTIIAYDHAQLPIPTYADRLPETPKDNITEGLFNDIFPSITHMRLNSKGELFVNDLNHHRIWKIIPHKEVIPFAGGQQGYKDGKGTEAQFYFPTAMSFDAQDNMYVADTGNHAIRKITPDGTVTTFYKEP